MQISNTILVACATAAAICIIPLSRGADSDAQAKAREALRKKLSEIQAGPVVQDSQTISKARQALRQRMAETGVLRADTDAQNKAREALRKRVGELQAASAGPESPAVSKARQAVRQKINDLQNGVVAPSVASAPAALPTSAAQVSSAPPARADSINKAREALHQKMGELETQSAATAGEPESTAKARQALHQKIADLNLQPAVSSDRAAQVVFQAKTKAASADQKRVEEERQPKVVSTSQTEFRPLDSPGLPISSDKQRRLADLLIRYKADELTPVQYQEQRAKILGEP